jgi:hypothetical protein
MANGHVDGGAEPDLPAGGDGYPSDLKDSEWARREPMVPPGSSGRTAAQNRHPGQRINSPLPLKNGETPGVRHKCSLNRPHNPVQRPPSRPFAFRHARGREREPGDRL